MNDVFAIVEAALRLDADAVRSSVEQFAARLEADGDSDTARRLRMALSAEQAVIKAAARGGSAEGAATGADTMKHTPEPWHTDSSGMLLWIVGADGSDVAMASPGNAERIVACVNAMAGIVPPAWTAERPTVDGIYWYRRHVGAKPVTMQVNGGTVWMNIHVFEPIDSMPGKFYGPLLPPREETVE